MWGRAAGDMANKGVPVIETKKVDI